MTEELLVVQHTEKPLQPLIDHHHISWERNGKLDLLVFSSMPEATGTLNLTIITMLHPTGPKYWVVVDLHLAMNVFISWLQLHIWMFAMNAK